MSKLVKWLLGVIAVCLVLIVGFVGYRTYEMHQIRQAITNSQESDSNSESDQYSESSEKGEAYEDGKVIKDDLSVGDEAKMKFAAATVKSATILPTTESSETPTTLVNISWESKEDDTEFRTDYFTAYDKQGKKLEAVSLVDDSHGPEAEDTDTDGVKKNTVVKGNIAFDGVATKVVYTPANIQDGVKADQATWIIK